jgi:aspartate racemase
LHHPAIWRLEFDKMPAHEGAIPDIESGQSMTYACAMRTIGIIGGMSWQSSQAMYGLVNELVNQRLGGHHSARVVLTSVDFQQVVALQHAGDWDSAAELLAGEARRLQAAGAECVVLATNTMHKLAPQIAAAIDVPFLHVADAVQARCQALGATTVGLLGTRFTMQEPFYVDLLAERGITAWVPDPVGQVDVDAIIFEHLVHGRTPAPARERYCEVMAALVDKGCEAIVLGCTEIMLLVCGDDASVPVIDTTLEQARMAVDWAFA